MNELLKILKEAAIRFSGSLTAMALGYVLLMVITRFLTPEEYGTFVLAQSIAGVSLILVLLGTPKTLDRFIPFFNAAGEYGKTKTLLFTVFRFALVLSVVTALILFAASGVLSHSVFKNPRLPSVLRVMLLTVPALAIVDLVSFTFAGFKELRYPVYIQQLTLPLTRLVTAIAAFAMGYRLLGWTWMHVLSVIASSVLALWFFKRHILAKLSGIRPSPIRVGEIFSYSWPLTIHGIVLIIMGQVGFLLLGYFRPSAEIGIYRIYFSLATVSALVLQSVAQIYRPVISGLISQGRLDEVREAYRRVTKWIFLINALGCMILFLFGSRIVSLLFTERYVVAPAALLILAAGYFVKSSFGPEGTTLEAFGNTRLAMMNSLIWLGSNLGLSFILIPRCGIVGAAIASSGSFVIGGLAALVEIYVLHGLQPFDVRYLRYVAVALTAGSVVYVLDLRMAGAGAGILTGLVLLLAAFYVVGLHVSRSLDPTDYEVLSRIRAKIADVRGAQ